MPPMEQTAVLLTLMRELEGLMRAESALLRDMRLERLQALQTEKAALAEAYEAELQRLRRAPEAVAALPREARETLEAAMRQFQAAAQVNRRRLEAARQVVECVMRALGDGLAAGQGTAGYRPGGSAASGRVVSLALNRRV